MSSENDVLSISKLAQMFGLDRATMAKRLQGLEPVSESNAGKLFRLGDVVRKLTEQRPAETEDAKNRKTQADAELAELKLAERRGEVVPISIVRDELHTIIKGIYQRCVVTFPQSVADKIVGLSAGEAQKILRDEIAIIFDELRSSHQAYIGCDLFSDTDSQP